MSVFNCWLLVTTTPPLAPDVVSEFAVARKRVGAFQAPVFIQPGDGALMVKHKESLQLAFAPAGWKKGISDISSWS